MISALLPLNTSHFLALFFLQLRREMLLVNLVCPDLTEMETLLEIVQSWIRERHKGRGPVVQLLEEGSSPQQE